MDTREKSHDGGLEASHVSATSDTPFFTGLTCGRALGLLSPSSSSSSFNTSDFLTQLALLSPVVPARATGAATASSFISHPSMQQPSPFLQQFASASNPPPMALGGQLLARNSTKTLKCPRCNWHYKYQETLEIHMKEKHDIVDGAAGSGMECCVYCVESLPHPKLARGESYSCGYKPYRCDLCKYSTTTKGNLSIHMQSDKHLNAVQESIPQSMAAVHCCSPAVGFGSIASGSADPLLLGSQTLRLEQADPDSTAVGAKCAVEGELMGSRKWEVFSCLICCNFSTSNLEAMLEHLEVDRSAIPPMPGDIQNAHGQFRCNLCPYSSSLKANFQLHTRTDKHLQRLQLVNHIREGRDAANDLNTLIRLASIKSSVQVQCRLCQEVLTCAFSLREHCETRATHLRNLHSLLIRERNEEAEAVCNTLSNVPIPSLYHALCTGTLIFKCAAKDEEGKSPGGSRRLLNCPFSTCSVDEAIEHLNVHQQQCRNAVEVTTPGMIASLVNDSGNEFCTATFDSHPQLDLQAANSRHQPASNTNEHFSWEDLNAEFLRMDEARIMQSGQNDAPADERGGGTQEGGDPKPHEQRDTETAVHSETSAKNTEEAEAIEEPSLSGVNDVPVDKATNYTLPQTSDPADCTQLEAPSCPERAAPHGESAGDIYSHRCHKCSMAFKCAERLDQHRLSHESFTLEQKCPFTGDVSAAVEKGQCAEAASFASPTSLRRHIASEHPKEQISLQSRDTGTHPEGQSHMNEQLLALLMKQPHSSMFLPYLNFLADPAESKNAKGLQSKKPYRCNVCRLSYAVASTLDTHLRSFAHQSRMKRLRELVETGEVNPQKPVSEQPGGIPQKRIAELIEVKGKSVLDRGGIEHPTDLSLRRDRCGSKEPRTTSMGKSTPINSAAAPLHRRAGEDGTSASTRAISTSSSSFSPQTTTTMKGEMDKQHFPDFASQLSASPSSNPLLASFMAQLAMVQMLQQQQLQQQTTDKSSTFQRQLMEAATGGDYSPASLLNPLLGPNPLAILGGALSQPNQMKDHFKYSLSRENEDHDVGEGVAPKHKGAPKSEGRTTPKTSPLKLAQAENKARLQQSRSQTEAVESLGNQLTTSPLFGFPEVPLISSTLSSQEGVDFARMCLAAMNSLSAGNGSTVGDEAGAFNDGSPQKRARTRITDDQLRVLRQYFDINNSPSEEQIKEMSQKAQLPEKVIKHWFRNTLFKERQRDKDSPYNFSIPPKLSIDLDVYEKTGEAKVTSLLAKSEPGEEGGDQRRADAVGVKERRTSREGSQPSPASSSSSPSSHQKRVIDAVSSYAGSTNPTGKRGRYEEVEEEDPLAGSISDATSPSPDLTKSILIKSLAPAAAMGKSMAGADSSGLLEQWQKVMAAAGAMHFPGISMGFNAFFGPTAFMSPPFSGNTGAAANDSSSSSAGSSEGGGGSGGPAEAKPLALPALLTSTSGTPSSPFFSNFLTPASQATTAPLQRSSSSPYASGGGSIAQTNGNSPSSSPSTTATNSITVPTSVLGGGRRANRTRFTDFQLKTLQNFFDRQAYPKDDDLEMLSKKLGLSPRVIVVWFQNARQKARKIFENNPAAIASAVMAAPTAVVTSMQLQEHQRLTSQRPAVEENLSEEEKNTPAPHSAGGDGAFLSNAAAFTSIFAEEGNGNHQKSGEGASEESRASMNANLMALLAATGTFNLKLSNESNKTNENNTRQKSRIDAADQSIKGGGGKESNGVLTQPTRPAQHSPRKKCPFCDLLQTKDALVSHIARHHSEQMPNATIGVLVDALQNVDDNEVGTTGAMKAAHNHLGAESTTPLDLSRTNAPALKTEIGSETVKSAMMQGGKAPTEACPAENPATEISDGDGEWAGNDAAYGESEGGSPPQALPTAHRPMCSERETRMAASLFAQYPHQRRPDSRNNSKRYRTHLTPLQVYIMKCIFNDYKTPSMGECDQLGKQIGLHKRVVQVWFQNARAKLRKSRAEEEMELKSLPTIGCSTDPNIAECKLCGLDFATRGLTMQDHLLSVGHISRVRETSATVCFPNRSTQQQSGEDGEEGYEEETTARSKRCKSADEHYPSTSPHHTFSTQLAPYYGLPFPAQANSLPLSAMLFSDPSLYGTPIKALQIPSAVQEKISSELLLARDYCKFTQDGLQLSQLEAKVSPDDFTGAAVTETEVGWACRQCSNVFQQESLLENHQKLICRDATSSRPLCLIQIYYECLPCSAKFGIQEEFRLHCLTNEHRSAARVDE